MQNISSPQPVRNCSIFPCGVCVVIIGKEPGRKKDINKKIDNFTGQLSLYNSTTLAPVASSTETETSNNLLNSKPAALEIPKSVKGVNSKRGYAILMNILINNKDILDIIVNKSQVQEENIIVDLKHLKDESFFLYNQYLNSSKEFSSLFSNDGFKQFISLMNQYVRSRNCKSCSILFKDEKPYKQCFECKEFYHVNCIENLKTLKKWYCIECS